jgi:hypothetical protein
MGQGGYCINREGSHHEATGVYRIDFYSDNTSAETFFTISALVSSVLLLCIEFVNRSRFRKSDGANEVYLLLPSYFGFLTAMMIVNLCFCFIYFASGEKHHNEDMTWGELIPVSLQYGLLHFFFEAPTFFLLRGGAANSDVVAAMGFGFISFLLAFGMLLLTGYYALLFECFVSPFAIYISYQGGVTAAYAFIALFPNLFVTRRPALLPYARCMLFYNIMWLAVSFSLFFGPDIAYCGAYIAAFVLDGIFPVFVLYYAFILDSQVCHVTIMYEVYCMSA